MMITRHKKKLASSQDIYPSAPYIFNGDLEQIPVYVQYLDLEHLYQNMRPRHNLMCNLVVLNDARGDLQGASRYWNDFQQQFQMDRRNLDDPDPANPDDAGTYYYQESNAPWSGPPGVFDPWTGSSYSAGLCGYIYNAFGSGDGECPVRINGGANPDCYPRQCYPMMQLASWRGGGGPGCDQHIKQLLTKRPEFLSPSLWGARAALGHRGLTYIATLRMNPRVFFFLAPGSYWRQKIKDLRINNSERG